MVDFLTIVLIAFGLAIDSFAVSIANGMKIKSQRRRFAFLTAGFFGGFQILMLTIGWFAGRSLESIIMEIDHWVAFGLLAFIGSKMIYDALRKKKNEKEEENLTLYSLLILSFATSIDSLMVGLSFAFLQTFILLPIVTVGAVTFLLSLLGFYFGYGIARFFGNRVKILGGIILIAIGLRILIEDLFF